MIFSVMMNSMSPTKHQPSTNSFFVVFLTDKDMCSSVLQDYQCNHYWVEVLGRSKVITEIVITHTCFSFTPTLSQFLTAIITVQVCSTKAFPQQGIAQYWISGELLSFPGILQAIIWTRLYCLFDNFIIVH